MIGKLWKALLVGLSVLLCQGLTDDDRKQAEDFFSRGYAYMRLGKYKLALKDFDRAIDIFSDYFDAYLNRANVHSHLGNYEESISDSQTALKLNPESSHAYLNLGLAYEKTGNKKEAKKCLVKAAELGNVLAKRYLYSLRGKKK